MRGARQLVEQSPYSSKETIVNPRNALKYAVTLGAAGCVAALR